MDKVLWLSGDDVAKTGVCRMDSAVEIVQRMFQLFDQRSALIAEESALRHHGSGGDQACYALPAYVGGTYDVCGVKWTAHGVAEDASKDVSRIQAAVILNQPERAAPLAVLNGTEIGAVRTGAVTALALRCLAPENVGKVALCGAGGQAVQQLKAVLYALPHAREVAVWSRGCARAERLVCSCQKEAPMRLYAAPTVDEAVEGADVIIGATSASEPYLTADQVKSAMLYCHIGYHEITAQAVDCFNHVVVDTWEEAKNVSGQSLFRYYRAGQFPESRLTGTLGAVLSGRLSVPRGTQEEKILFDAFGLPIFDIGLAKEAYIRAQTAGLGIELPW